MANENQTFSIDIKIEPNCGKYLLFLSNKKPAPTQEAITQSLHAFSQDENNSWRNSIMALLTEYNDMCSSFVLSEMFEPYASTSNVRYSEKGGSQQLVHAVEDPSFRRVVVSVRQKRDCLLLTEEQGIELIRAIKKISEKSNDLFFTTIATFDVYPSCQFYFNMGKMHFANQSFVGVNLDTVRATRAIQFVNHINDKLK